MNFWKQSLCMVFFCLLYATPVLGEKVTVVTPYCGTEENTYQNGTYGLNLKDSQTMKGLFVQSVDSEKYQWNIFLYQTADINSSDIQGVNFIYDRYFGTGDRKKVIGIGMNYLEMEMAGRNVPSVFGNLDALNLDMTISSPYVRVGQYFNFGDENWRYTVLPWVGAQVDYTEGTGRVDFPGPGAANFDIDDDPFSWIAGVNFKMNFHHFLQLEAKHSIAYHDDRALAKYSAILNLFLNRNVGLSYRYNHHETSTGTDSYNIFGVAVMF